MSVLLHLQWNSVVWKMREEFGLLPGGVERLEQAPPASPQVDLVTNGTRRQNHSVRRFRLPQIETSTRSALIKRHSMTSSSPGGARVAPLILARHRFLCSHFSAGGVGEKVFYYRSDKRGRRSVAAWLLVPGESSDASGGGGRGALMSRGNVLNQRRGSALVSSSTRRACKSQTAAGRRLWSRKGTVAGRLNEMALVERLAWIYLLRATPSPAEDLWSDFFLLSE